MRADLHTHTTASDGTLTPDELAARAAAERVDAIAVTDHDTVDAVDAARAAGARLGVRVIAGVELSCARDAHSVHVLGLFVDVADPALQTALDDFRAERESRAIRIVERLNALGHRVSMQDVRAQAGAGVIARPHVARALAARGVVASPAAAFTPELIGDAGRAYVPHADLTVEDAVALVATAGGVAVLAHPGRTTRRAQAPRLEDALSHAAASGVAGVEVDHPDHARAVRDRLRDLASRLGLVATGGSDFHGFADRRLGSCTTTQDALDRLESLASTRRS